MLPPPAMTNPNTPIAFVRSAASVKRVMISESATAETTAPPTPCTARAATSMPWLVDRPQTTEAAVKSAIPARNIRRCPNRSPRRPPRSRKPPNVSRYAFTTQASEVSVKPRSSRIDGSATFTIVVSSDDHQVAEAEDDQGEPAGAGVGDGHSLFRFYRSDATPASKLIGHSSALIANASAKPMRREDPDEPCLRARTPPASSCRPAWSGSRRLRRRARRRSSVGDAVVEKRVTRERRRAR